MQSVTDTVDLDAFIRSMPKAELHMHLEGSIEAEALLELAVRNGMRPRWDTAEALRAAYQFNNLQSFLDLYYEGCRVLVRERDFYEITRTYLRHAHADAVVRAEMFLAPQGFIERGVPVAEAMGGVLAAMRDAAIEHGISSGLLIVAQRHRSEAEALRMLDAVMPWADQIAGFGLGGAELGHPPSGFVQFFRACRERGFHITAHAGEEGPASYVREAIELLDVDRIDHGNTCLDDPALVRELVARATPLTVCPLSNLRLNVVPSLAAHPLHAMLDAGLCVTMNSDDPAYFGGTINDNFIQCRHALGLSADDIVTLARNSLEAAFVLPEDAARYVALLDAYVADYQSNRAA
jgi:adenosine deaminase